MANYLKVTAAVTVVVGGDSHSFAVNDLVDPASEFYPALAAVPGLLVDSGSALPTPPPSVPAPASHANITIVSSAAPPSPAFDTLWLDETTNVLKRWDSAAWRPTGIFAGRFEVDLYGADPTGVNDSAAAINAALAAMPTRTIYEGGASGNTGNSKAFPVGVLVFGTGTYKLGSGVDVNNLGPFVSVIGQGKNSTILSYVGHGDCLRLYNDIKPSSDTFDTLAAWAGRIDGFTIDGTGSSVGACGLHFGDTEGGSLGPDLDIRNFSSVLPAPVLSLGAGASSGGTFGAGTYYWKVVALCGTTNAVQSGVSNQVSAAVAANGTQTLTWATVTGATGYRLYRADASSNYYLVTEIDSGATTSYTDTGGTGLGAMYGWPVAGQGGSVGLCFDNQHSWTENNYGRVSLYNNAVHVLFNGTGGSNGDGSFEYNDLTFKIYCLAAQEGVILQNGAYYDNGSLKIRANMLSGASSASLNAALMTIQGAGLAGHIAAGTASQIDNCHLEIQAETNGTASNGPMTIRFGSTSKNILRAEGTMVFGGGQYHWQKTNWTPSGNSNVQWIGRVSGDGNLAGNADAHNQSQVVGPLAYGQSTGTTAGSFKFDGGDMFQKVTLTGNMVVTFTNCQYGAQRKVIVLQQAASGGPYSVTWPHNANPTTSAPTVLWPSGTAPTMSTAASAIDVYELTTLDGATWYGRAIQAVA